LAEQEKNVHVAFLSFVQRASKIDLAPLFEQRNGIEAVLRQLDQEVARFANAWPAAFVAVAQSEAKAVQRKLAKAATIAVDFNIGDPEAARLMEQSRLNLIQNLTSQQRELVRQALSTGLARGEGTAAMARRFRNVIGLAPVQSQQLDRYRASLEASRSPIDADLLGPGEKPAVDVLTPKQIETMVASQAKQLVAARAEAIARTESLRITSMARTEAVRQSMQATGQQHAGREWASTHDGRTRADHAEADGQRRRLDQPYSVGGEQISAPGQGSARQSINCRCTELFEFFDSEQELRAWLQAGT
jgi:hypothetical protein